MKLKTQMSKRPSGSISCASETSENRAGLEGITELLIASIEDLILNLDIYDIQKFKHTQ